MKSKNSTPNEIIKQIDQELDKNSRYNATMTKVKVATPTMKDILVQFIKDQTEFNKNQTKFNQRIESKVDNNTTMIQQAHPELFNNKK